MGNKYTQAQAEASRKWQQQRTSVKVNFLKDEKKEWEQFVAAHKFESMTQFIKDAMAFYREHIEKQ